MNSALLPHQSDILFLTDGGTETWLEYKRGQKLTNFSAFHLLNNDQGAAALREYYTAFARIALSLGTGFIFDSLTYRASRDWGDLLGYSKDALAEMNHRCLALYRDVAADVGLAPEQVLISGCIGPKGDAYDLHQTLSAAQAQAYHAEQIETFVAAKADLVTALTLNSVEEAIGMTRAAKDAAIPVVISFTIEKDQRLGSGETLGDAIRAVDAATDNAPAYYMLNCAHPVDFVPALDDADWTRRVQGVRSNASSLEHGILCQLGHLEEGDPDELAAQHRDLKLRFPHMTVFGGCCGTDFVHVEGIARAILGLSDA
ncbi:homocysteine S-methyltransferase family protein [Aliiroseovarius subalbicans]|uniref:homocysteine S-methyltransferase family protein n=1 Tax=Aliiroseovarius subalbicans TaxID=2925840 RepID=UPI001F59ADCE|nr:homocysteine S-methyltransferase family protein [Aliiroseovarius subalbicans]MCI2398092.1 homocysteine S-methyltransferase family protein [Aliiroseovarius subalbicans]